MREFLTNNKSNIIKIGALLFVFLFIATFWNGKKIHDQRKMMKMEMQKMEVKTDEKTMEDRS